MAVARLQVLGLVNEVRDVEHLERKLRLLFSGVGGVSLAVIVLVLLPAIGTQPDPRAPTAWDVNSNFYGEGNVYLVEYLTANGTIVGMTVYRPADIWINPDSPVTTVGPVPDVPEGSAVANVTADSNLQDFLDDFRTPNSHVWRYNTTTHLLEVVT
jgi:hypothetical protein